MAAGAAGAARRTDMMVLPACGGFFFSFFALNLRQHVDIGNNMSLCGCTANVQPKNQCSFQNATV